VNPAVRSVSSRHSDPVDPSVRLFWLPLGAGGHSVRWNGRIFEWFVARREHRTPCPLYHSALEVQLGRERHVIEMAPVWAGSEDHGAVLVGPVGARWLGRSPLFRYEVRRWRNGSIPDADQAVDSPQILEPSQVRAQQLLDLVPQVPALTWGRDELGTGDMWNSNSLVSWLLARSGHEVSGIAPPQGGRAPGWQAGLVLAERQAHGTSGGEREDLRPSCPRLSALP
jgi:hypothetical protein